MPLVVQFHIEAPVAPSKQQTLLSIEPNIFVNGVSSLNASYMDAPKFTSKSMLIVQNVAISKVNSLPCVYQRER
jgi:hypothetical protein